MSLSADWKEFVTLLNSHGVEYLIVGAHNLAFRGRPRYTGDLDILVRPSSENAAKPSAVMNKFVLPELTSKNRTLSSQTK